MATLVVILEEGNREIRIQDVSNAQEQGDSVVAYNEHNQVKARFKVRDLRSWHVEA